jgi:hypothetical protein
MIFYGASFGGASLIREMTKISFWIYSAFVLTGPVKKETMADEKVTPSLESHRPHS